MSTPALEIDHISKSFGALRVSREVTLTLESGARHALIGPNGAGKTTMVNLITGLLEPSDGRIRLAGTDITDLDPGAPRRAGPCPHVPDQLAVPGAVGGGERGARAVGAVRHGPPLLGTDS